jgi:hypothetical protein
VDEYSANPIQQQSVNPPTPALQTTSLNVAPPASPSKQTLNNFALNANPSNNNSQSLHKTSICYDNRKISSCSALSANSLALNPNHKSHTYIANNKKKIKNKYGGGGGGVLRRGASFMMRRRSSSARRKSSQQVFRRDSTINSKIIPFLILIKETRTAFMLFVISIVFIACYLPSILATRSLLPNDNLYIVYLYFCNSALNPIIYSFMNRNFRSELHKLFFSKRKKLFSASRFSSFNAFSMSVANKFEMKSL